MNIDMHLAWTATLSVLLASTFYCVLRVLGVPWVHALLIASLTIVFPWSDSTRLWATANQVTLSMTFASTGLLVALIGLNRRKWYWHAGAGLLYLLSILTYEVTLALIASVGALYWLHAGWRAARFRWIVDFTIVLFGAVWVGSNTARSASELSGNLDHLVEIVLAGGTILGRTIWPLGSPETTVALVGLALVVGAGMLAYLTSPDRFVREDGWGLRNWLVLSGAGLAATVLGWVMFVPADPYYTPTVYGETNRVNGLAAFGLVTFTYAVIGIGGTLIGQIRPKVAAVPAVVTVVVAALLLASYVGVLRRHIGIWHVAFLAEKRAMAKIKKKVPDPRPGTTLFVSSYPANQTLGVPILATSWDLNGMVSMAYDDSSIAAYPVLPDLQVDCLGYGVTLKGSSAPEDIGAYGEVRLLNLESGRMDVPHNQRECRRVAHRHTPGPLYVSLTY